MATQAEYKKQSSNKFTVLDETPQIKHAVEANKMQSDVSLCLIKIKIKFDLIIFLILVGVQATSHPQNHLKSRHSRYEARFQS